MMLCYDLHAHSTVSDGELSPADLVKRASAKGVDVLALTDHDATHGLEEASITAKRLGLALIPGVEISVTWNKRLIHILGLGINSQTPSLQQGLAKLRQLRQWRAVEIGKRFEKIGISNVYQGAQKYATGEIVSRTHFARYLVAQEVVKDVQKAFKRYLKQGKPGYVPCKWAELEDAVGWIRQAGGQAVVAHPARYKMGLNMMKSFLDEFKQVGGLGIEVVTSSHSHHDSLEMAKHAQRFGLLASRGSDFHTPENSWVELGRLPELPEGCVPIWQDWDLEMKKVG